MRPSLIVAALFLTTSVPAVDAYGGHAGTFEACYAP